MLEDHADVAAQPHYSCIDDASLRLLSIRAAREASIKYMTVWIVSIRISGTMASKVPALQRFM